MMLNLWDFQNFDSVIKIVMRLQLRSIVQIDCDEGVHVNVLTSRNHLTAFSERLD